MTHWLLKIQKYFIHRKKQFKTWILSLAVAKIPSQYHKHFKWFFIHYRKTILWPRMTQRYYYPILWPIITGNWWSPVTPNTYYERENKSLSFEYRNIRPKASIQPWMQSKIRQTNKGQWPRLDHPSQFSHLLPC